MYAKISEEAGFVIYGYFMDHGRTHIHIYRGSASGPVLVLEFPSLSELDCSMKANEKRAAINVVMNNAEVIVMKLTEMKQQEME